MHSYTFQSHSLYGPQGCCEVIFSLINLNLWKKITWFCLFKKLSSFRSGHFAWLLVFTDIFWGEVHWNYLWSTGQTFSLTLGYNLVLHCDDYMLLFSNFYFFKNKVNFLGFWIRVLRQEEMHIELLFKLVPLIWTISTLQLRFLLLFSLFIGLWHMNKLC